MNLIKEDLIEKKGKNIELTSKQFILNEHLFSEIVNSTNLPFANDVKKKKNNNKLLPMVFFLVAFQ